MATVTFRDATDRAMPVGDATDKVATTIWYPEESVPPPVGPSIICQIPGAVLGLPSIAVLYNGVLQEVGVGYLAPPPTAAIKAPTYVYQYYFYVYIVDDQGVALPQAEQPEFEVQGFETEWGSQYQVYPYSILEPLLDQLSPPPPAGASMVWVNVVSEIIDFDVVSIETEPKQMHWEFAPTVYTELYKSQAATSALGSNDFAAATVTTIPAGIGADLIREPHIEMDITVDYPIDYDNSGIYLHLFNNGTSSSAQATILVTCGAESFEEVVPVRANSGVRFPLDFLTVGETLTVEVLELIPPVSNNSWSLYPTLTVSVFVSGVLTVEVEL